jgi:hypothetical protein
MNCRSQRQGQRRRRSEEDEVAMEMEVRDTLMMRILMGIIKARMRSKTLMMMTMTNQETRMEGARAREAIQEPDSSPEEGLRTRMEAEEGREVGMVQEDEAGLVAQAQVQEMRMMMSTEEERLLASLEVEEEA